MNEYYNDPVTRDLLDHRDELQKKYNKLYNVSQAIRKIVMTDGLTEHDTLEAIKYTVYLSIKDERFRSIEEEKWMKAYERN